VTEIPGGSAPFHATRPPSDTTRGVSVTSGKREKSAADGNGSRTGFANPSRLKVPSTSANTKPYAPVSITGSASTFASRSPVAGSTGIAPAARSTATMPPGSRRSTSSAIGASITSPGPTSTSANPIASASNWSAYGSTTAAGAFSARPAMANTRWRPGRMADSV